MAEEHAEVGGEDGEVGMGTGDEEGTRWGRNDGT